MLERRLVVILFVLVFITFSFAHEDSKEFEQIYTGKTAAAPSAIFTASKTEKRKIKKTAEAKVFQDLQLNLR